MTSCGGQKTEAEFQSDPSLPPNSRGEEGGGQSMLQLQQLLPAGPRVQAGSLEVWREAWGWERVTMGSEGPLGGDAAHTA